MSEEKKTVASEEIKEEARQLSEKELEKVTGGAFSITGRGTVATGRIETGDIHVGE